jgi:methylamine utilization protein MauE
MTPQALPSLVNELRELQAPILAVMLLGACAAKITHAVQTHSLAAGLGPTELFPLPARRPAALIVWTCELALGAALLVTVPPAARDGTGALDGAATDGARIAATAFFVVAMCALIELRGRRPDVGCGCFGDLSTRPVGARSIARPALLAVAALASIGGPGLHMPRTGTGAALLLALLCAEFLVIALLSPEAGEALVRLGYSEPCEVRSIPARRTLAALHHSPQWPQRAGLITSDAPSDMWRELCWRYVVYPGRLDGAEADVVFAVQMKPRRPVIKSAVVPRPAPITSPADQTSPGNQTPPEDHAPPEDQTPPETSADIGAAQAPDEAPADLAPGTVPLSAMPVSNTL